MGQDNIRYFLFLEGRWRWRPTKTMRAAGFSMVPMGRGGPDRDADGNPAASVEDRKRAIELNAEWDAVRLGFRPPQKLDRPLFAQGSVGDGYQRALALREAERRHRGVIWNAEQRSRDDWPRAWKWIGPAFGDCDPKTIQPEHFLKMDEKTGVVSGLLSTIEASVSITERHRVIKVWRSLWVKMASMGYCSADADPTLSIRNTAPQPRQASWQRREVLKGEALKEQVVEMTEDLVEDIVGRYSDKETHPSDWDLAGLRESLYHQFNLRLDFSTEEEDSLSPESLWEMANHRVLQAYEDKEKRFGEPMLRQLEKIIMLQTIDSLWKDHLLNMDHLKEGIGLRGYGQKNPLQEYQKEGFDMFEEMVRRKEEDVVQKLFTVELARESVAREIDIEQPRPQRMVLSRGEDAISARASGVAVKREGEKVGRNDPCPCGSGKKYKRCHGK